MAPEAGRPSPRAAFQRPSSSYVGAAMTNLLFFLPLPTCAASSRKHCFSTLLPFGLETSNDPGARCATESGFVASSAPGARWSARALTARRGPKARRGRTRLEPRPGQRRRGPLSKTKKKRSSAGMDGTASPPRGRQASAKENRHRERMHGGACSGGICGQAGRTADGGEDDTEP